MTDEEKDIWAKDIISLAKSVGIKLVHIKPSKSKEKDYRKIGKYYYFQERGFWKISTNKPRKIFYYGKNPSFDPEKDMLEIQNRKKSPG